tara:strand:+ start:16963 stop:20907 length:3945 start_codon:yes stop_codon:yes gene_type:complete
MALPPQSNFALGQSLLAPQPGFALGPEVPAAPAGRYNYIEEFTRSAGAGLGELVGLDPSPRVEQFREDNPVGGLTSQAVSFVTPYVGWLRATRAAATVGKLSRLGSVARAPMLTAASREAIRFAPLEAGRVGLSAALGGDVGETARSALANTAFAFVGGGVAGAIGSAGKNLARGPELSNRVDMRAPLTLQLRQLREAMAEGTVTSMEAAQRHSAELAAAVRAQTPSGSMRTVGPLTGENTTESTRFFNRLFEHKPKGKSWTRSRFVEGSRFETTDDALEMLSRAGLKDKEDLVQFPTYVKASTSSGAREVHRGLMEHAGAQVAPNTWMIREADDGLFVVAKRFAAAKPTRGGKPYGTNDEWVVFKTDTPGAFAPSAEKFSKSVISRNSWLWPTQNVHKAIGAEAFDTTLKLTEDLPLNNFLDETISGLGASTKALAEKMPAGAQVLGRKLADFTRHYLTPTMFQFNNAPRAQRMFSIARITQDNAGARAQALMYGEESLDAAGNLVASFFGATTKRNYQGKTPIKAIIDTLDDADMDGVTRAWVNHWSPKDVAREYQNGNISENLNKFLTKMNEFDTWQHAELSKTMRAVGLTPPPFLQGRLGLTRTWRGDQRIGIFDKKGNTVWVASGRNAQEAESEAQAVIEAAAGEGNVWTQGATRTSTPGQDLDAVLNGIPENMVAMDTPEYMLASIVKGRRGARVARPGAFREQKGMRGFVGDRSALTKEELEKTVFSGVQRYQKYMAELSVNRIMEDDMAVLALENPLAHRLLGERFAQMSGRPGPVAQFQNDVVDQVLAPVLGKGGATKIVGALNHAMYQLQFGFGNLMFPAMNALTFLTTTMPQVAFVMESSIQSAQRYYSMMPVAGAAGKVQGTVGVLDMMKIVGRSFKELGRPDAGLVDDFGRAVREGVVDPKFVEEYAGETAHTVSRVRETLRGENGMMKLLGGASSYLPSVSEKFSRGHTFTLGRIVGRDLLGHRGEQLYRFSRDFTNNSMFMYSNADRANAITTPVGSMFGLFKNWPMHQLAWMAEYAGMGMNHGQWGPLLYMMAGVGATGGAAAVPGFAAADWIAKKSTGQSLQSHLYNNFSDDGDDSMMADAVYYGLPAMMGVSLQGSASAPFADPVRDANLMFSMVQWNRMKAGGDLVGGAIDRFNATGEHPVSSPEVRDAFIRAFAPRSITRSVQVMRDQYVRSLNSGYPQVELSGPERFAYALGFNPVGLDRSYAAQSELWADQDQMRARVATYGQAWAEAVTDRKFDDLHGIMQAATRQGVPLDSVIRSSQTRMARARENMFQRQFAQEAIQGQRSIVGSRIDQ